MSPAVRAKIQSSLKNNETDYGYVGQSVAVLKNGKLVYSGSHGFAVKEFEVKATEHTVYQLFSISKLFTLQILMGLVEDQKLDLNTPVGRILDGLPSAWSEVTVFQLMNHVSGLPEYYGHPSQVTPQTAEAALESVKDAPLAFETGSRNTYNQTNFLLLKQIIEKRTGRDYEQTLNEQIRRDGLTNTRYGNQFAVIPGRATTYASSPNGLEKLNFIDQPKYMMTATGLNSNVVDLARWFGSLLSGGNLTPETVAKMWEPVSLNDGSLSSFTHGWERETNGSVTNVGHGGGGRNDVRHFMRKGGEETITVIFLSNGSAQFYNPRNITRSIANIVSEGTLYPLLDLSDAMYHQIAGGRVEEALKLYRAHQAKATSDLSTEAMLNSLGYRVMMSLNAEKALPIFSLNVAEHPQAANPYDSLGEAYLNLNNREQARIYYAKAQALAPNDRVAQILRDLADR